MRSAALRRPPIDPHAPAAAPTTGCGASTAAGGRPASPVWDSHDSRASKNQQFPCPSTQAIVRNLDSSFEPVAVAAPAEEHDHRQDNSAELELGAAKAELEALRAAQLERTELICQLKAQRAAAGPSA